MSVYSTVVRKAGVVGESLAVCSYQGDHSEKVPSVSEKIRPLLALDAPFRYPVEAPFHSLSLPTEPCNLGILGPDDMLSPAQRLAQAVEHHEAGRLDQAEA